MSVKTSSPVVTYLSALRKTVRRRLLAYGAFAVLAGGVAAFLTILVLDWLLWLPPALRLLGGVLFAGGFVGATIYWIVLPLRAPIGVDELAAQLERRFERLQDQLSSAVHFLRQDATGSPAMVERVITDTEHLIRELPLDTALSVRPLSIRGVLFTMGAMVLTSAVLLAPTWVRTGVIRYARPWGAVEWPRSVEIQPLTADQQVALGESAVVRMAVQRGLHDALRGVVYLQEADGNIQVLALHREHDGTFFTTVDALTEDLTYWFEAGDDSTKRRSGVLRVVRRPEVIEALATIEPPPYAADRPPKTVDLADGPVPAPVGGFVTVSLRASKPIASDAAQEGIGLRTESGELIPLGIDSVDTRQASARIEVTSDISFRAELRDDQGFSNRGGTVYAIRALPDAPPTVTVLEPASLAESTPAGSLRVVVRVEDDFGLQRIALHVEGARDGRPLEISLPDRLSTAHEDAGVEVLSSYVWDFAPLNMTAGDVLLCDVVATDNWRGDQGQVGRSAPFRVKFISQSEFEVRAREELSVLEARLRQAILDQAGLRDRTIELVQTGDEIALTESDRETVGRIAGGQSRLSQQVRELAGRLQELVARMHRNHAGEEPDRARLRAAGDTLRRVAMEAMTAAAGRLGRISEQPTARSHQQELTSASDLQEEAVERLSDVLRSMSQWGAFAGLLARTRDLLDRQNAVRSQTAEVGPSMLGKALDSLTTVEAATLKRLERQQEQIADDLDRHLANLEQLADNTREKDPSGADAIEDALRVGRAHDVSKRARAAVEAVRNNRTAGAGLDQKAAADAIRKMVAALRERDERELAQLRKNLERAEDMVAVVLEEQRALRAATHETEQVGADEPTFENLAGGQRVLGRNTRMLGEELMELPRAMIPARRVGQAVDPMNRAETELRGRKASVAVPSQDEAIQHLTDALAGLEALARESTEEAFRRTITHIHEELEAIAGAQRAVNAGIVKLQSTVAETGRLGRLETREAGKLSRDQGEVRQMTADILPDLEKVPVYDWAMQRVGGWMDASRTQLDERRIDEELVNTTARVVSELDKLIAALVETQNLPATTEFAESDGQGGEDGQTAGAAAVPTVAELLVLKAMQIDINERTRILDSAFRADSATESQLRALAILGEDQTEVRRLTELVTEKAQGHGP